MYTNYWKEWKRRTADEAARQAERDRALSDSAMSDPDAKWAVVRNGRICYRGTAAECDRMIAADRTGELETYPMAAYNAPRN